MKLSLISLFINFWFVLFATSQSNVQWDSTIVYKPNGTPIRFLTPKEKFSGGSNIDSLLARDNTTRKTTLVAQTVFQRSLVSGTNIKTINNQSLLGSGNLALSGTGDLLAANNLSDVQSTATARTNLGLGNVTNESKATMFTSPAFTGTISIGGNVITFPSAAATLLPNTSTSGVATSPTASQTTTITHGLGRIPAIIRIYGIGAFASSTSATPTPFSMGTFNSTGNRCVYMTSNGTTAQASQTSTVFAVFLATSAGNNVSGIIQNVTSTTFDIVWTETGTAAAQNYLWEAQ